MTNAKPTWQKAKPTSFFKNGKESWIHYYLCIDFFWYKVKSKKFYQIRKVFTDVKGASLVAQLVKNPPEMQGTPVQFLGWEDPL